MRIPALLLGSVLLLVGCNSANKELSTLADRACECKDAACADKVVADLAVFTEKNKDARGDVKKAEADGIRMMKCLVTAGAKPDAIKKALKPMSGG